MLLLHHGCCLVAQSCPILCDAMDCSPPDSSIHAIFQARILEWVAISFSRDFIYYSYSFLFPLEGTIHIVCATIYNCNILTWRTGHCCHKCQEFVYAVKISYVDNLCLESLSLFNFMNIYWTLNTCLCVMLCLVAQLCPTLCDPHGL